MILMVIIIIIVSFLLFKFSKDQGLNTGICLTLLLVEFIFFGASSAFYGKKQKIINEENQYILVNEGIQKNDFLFSRSLQGWNAYKKDKDGLNYRKIFVIDKKENFAIDKNLYLVYSKIEKEKIKNMFLYLPFQYVTEEYYFTQKKKTEEK